LFLAFSFIFFLIPWNVARYLSFSPLFNFHLFFFSSGEGNSAMASRTLTSLNLALNNPYSLPLPSSLSAQWNRGMRGRNLKKLVFREKNKERQHNNQLQPSMRSWWWILSWLRLYRTTSLSHRLVFASFFPFFMWF